MYSLRLLLRFGCVPLGLLRLLRKHLDRVHSAGRAVDGAKHAGKRAGADAIQHLVVAVEEAGARLGAHQPLELILRDELAAQQNLLEIAERRVGRTELAPDALKLRIIDDVDIQRALGQLFRGFNVGHGTQ